jgi:hypothetical protein
MFRIKPREQVFFDLFERDVPFTSCELSVSHVLVERKQFDTVDPRDEPDVLRTGEIAVERPAETHRP